MCCLKCACYEEKPWFPWPRCGDFCCCCWGCCCCMFIWLLALALFKLLELFWLSWDLWLLFAVVTVATRLSRLSGIGGEFRVPEYGWCCGDREAGPLPLPPKALRMLLPPPPPAPPEPPKMLPLLLPIRLSECSFERIWWAARFISSGVMSSASRISRAAVPTNSESQYLPNPSAASTWSSSF